MAHINRFQAALDFIEDALEGEVRLGDLASLVGLSVTRFSHAFKLEYGIAPYQYLIERRIARAKRLLRANGKNIAAVAAECGFGSQSRFGQVFLRSVGTTPSGYRVSSAGS